MSACYTRLAGVSQEVSKLHSEYNKKTPYCLSEDTQKIYRLAGQEFATLAEYNSSQADIVRDSLLQNISWNKSEYNSYLDVSSFFLS